MTHRLSTHLARALLCGALLAASAPAALAGAGNCKTDATDGCDRPGLACTPPKGGKCVTIKTPVPLSAPKLSCECLVPPPPPSSRGVILHRPILVHPTPHPQVTPHPTTAPRNING
jgi:hypothetical protein